MRRVVCLLLLLCACFNKPNARCGFLCGPGGECPTDYSCVTADNRCHLVENGTPVDSCDEQVIDGPIADVPETPDAPVVIDAPPTPDTPPGTPDAPIVTPDVPISMPDAPPPIDARPPDAPPPPDAPEIDAM